MKIIFSNINYKNNNLEQYLESAALSNYYAQKHGFETIFFGDRISLRIYRKIQYNHFRYIDQNEIESFPKSLWNIGKLIVMSKMTEPFIHMDFDVFLKTGFDIKKLNHDIICLHDEMFVNFNRLQEIFENKKPIEVGDSKIISYNCGIVGGNDHNSLKESVNMVLNYIRNNYEFIDKISNNTYYSKRYPTIFFPQVLIEQIWLFQILKNYFKKNISVVIPTQIHWPNVENALRQNKVIHLMREKNNIWYKKYISDVITNLNIKY